jgi:hypothetical protein
MAGQLGFAARYLATLHTCTRVYVLAEEALFPLALGVTTT